jgi:PAS domain S-box-containing protein
MAERIRATDWSATSLGPRSSWCQPLRTTVNLTLATQFPTVILWGEELLLVYNDACAHVAGPKHPAALGRSARDVWPEVWHINQPIVESVMKRGETVSLENKLLPIARNGGPEDAYFTLCYCPIYLEDGSVGGSLVTLIETTAQVLREAEMVASERTRALLVQDITKRKKVEEALRRERDLVAGILNAVPVGVLTMDAAGHFTGANQRAAAMFGQSMDNLLRTHQTSLPWLVTTIDGAPLPADSRPFLVQMSTAKPISGARLAIHRQDGKRVAISVNTVPTFDEQGHPTGIIAALEDIAELERGEAEQRESAKRFAVAFEVSPIAKSITRLTDGVILDVNSAFCVTTGFAREEAIGNTSDGLNLWVAREDRGRVIQRLRTERRVVDHETQLRTKCGEIRIVRFSAVLMTAGNDTHIQTNLHDITEYKRAELALREFQQRLQAILDNASLLVYVKDLDGRLTLVNRQFETLLGLPREKLLGKTSHDLLPKRDADVHWANDLAAMATRDAVVAEEKNQEPDGTHTYLSTKFPLFDVAGEMTGVCGISADITEFKRAEEARGKLEVQLHQAQKMKSIGRLAGGVAHDFNNMLGVILGHVELSMEQVAPNHPIHADLLEIQQAGRRSADLARQLLAFARKQTVSPQVIDLNQTVEGMLKMLRRLIGEDIDLTWEPAADLWPVNVDPSQIDQVLANLCVNARDAIIGGGKMTIETGNSTFDHDYCASHAGYVDGEYVQIAVSDNGCGMDKETQSHLFEPFFTTKEVGKGTGLGLATVYGIVKQNHGFINVYSEPGHGTTFKLYLPRHGSAAKQGAESTTTMVTGGHEVILLVEDEQSILRMTKKMLERQGYTVVAASTPGEAIRMAREHAAEIHLLMTDVVMPEMNGRDLAKNLLSLYPGMKRLFMSGYTADVIAHHGVLDKGVNFIQKPFSGQELAAKVRKALEG